MLARSGSASNKVLVSSLEHLYDNVQSIIDISRSASEENIFLS